MIRKMIYAFDEYQSVPDKFNIEPEKDARIKEGMQLFIDYFKVGSINYIEMISGLFLSRFL